MNIKVFWVVVGIVLAMGAVSVIWLYGFWLPSEFESNNEILRNLCLENNLSFEKTGILYSESSYCYAQEGDIRTIYRAPYFMTTDFGDEDKQYLVVKK